METDNCEDEFERNDSDRENNVPNRFTPDWLRSFEDCGHYTDEEALEICENLRILAIILLESKAIKSIIDNNQQDKDTDFISHNKKKTA